MSVNKFYILTGAVQSGKTSLLQKFCAEIKNVDGFICPDEETHDLDELRILIDLDSNTKYLFQKNENIKPTDIRIGQFIFDAETFIIAQQKLLHLHKSKQDYLIIDEVGKLELMESGLEPALSIFMQNIMSTENKKIIIVVRASLLQAITEKYKLQEAKVLNISQFEKLFLL